MLPWFLLSTLKLDLLLFLTLNDNTNSINRLLLEGISKLSNWCEVEGLPADGTIIRCGINHWSLVKDKAVVVSDWCEFLVGHFDGTIRHHIHSVFLNLGIKLFSRIIKKCSFNMSTILVYQFNLQQFATGPGVSKLWSLCNSRQDHPVSCKRA